MYTKNKRICPLPNGVEDCLPSDCRQLDGLKESLGILFENWGFEKIDTPIVENFENFTFGSGAISAKRMFKMTDHDGSILVLRPDFTLPIGRIVATKLAGALPFKLFYEGKLFDTSMNAAFDAREYIQTGVELIGSSLPDHDAELIALAIESLKACGVEDFTIEIGQVSYFLGLMQEYGIDETLAEEIRTLVNSKNMLGVEMLFKNNFLDKEAFDVIRRLPSLFGGEEVLDRAAELCSNEVSRMALENLSLVYSTLKECGYEKYISIDLGILQRTNYYTGIVFKGISRYFGAALLAGGRYDKLIGTMGKDLPATGFAIWLNRILTVRKRQGTKGSESVIDYAVLAPYLSSELFEKVQELRGFGNRVDVMYGEDLNEFLSYCERKNVKNACVFRDGVIDNV